MERVLESLGRPVCEYVESMDPFQIEVYLETSRRYVVFKRNVANRDTRESRRAGLGGKPRALRGLAARRLRGLLCALPARDRRRARRRPAGRRRARQMYTNAIDALAESHTPNGRPHAFLGERALDTHIPLSSLLSMTNERSGSLAGSARVHKTHAQVAAKEDSLPLELTQALTRAASSATRRHSSRAVRSSNPNAVSKLSPKYEASVTGRPRRSFETDESLRDIYDTGLAFCIRVWQDGALRAAARDATRLRRLRWSEERVASRGSGRSRRAVAANVRRRTRRFVS